MYQCLKKGWLPLSDFVKEVEIDKANVSRYLKGLDSKYKCRIGTTLVVYRKEALKYIPNQGDK